MDSAVGRGCSLTLWPVCCVAVFTAVSPLLVRAAAARQSTVRGIPWHPTPLPAIFSRRWSLEARARREGSRAWHVSCICDPCAL